MAFLVTKNNEKEYIEMAPGIKRKTLVSGDKTMLCEFLLSKGVQLPMHKHPHEQTGYLVEGKLIFTIDGERQEVHPGDAWVIHSNVEHGVDVLESSRLVEVFSPVREDFK